jgi:hypothetical protein
MNAVGVLGLDLKGFMHVFADPQSNDDTRDHVSSTSSSTSSTSGKKVAESEQGWWHVCEERLHAQLYLLKLFMSFSHQHIPLPAEQPVKHTTRNTQTPTVVAATVTPAPVTTKSRAKPASGHDSRNKKK